MAKGTAPKRCPLNSHPPLITRGGGRTARQSERGCWLPRTVGGRFGAVAGIRGLFILNSIITYPPHFLCRENSIDYQRAARDSVRCDKKGGSRSPRPHNSYLPVMVEARPDGLREASTGNRLNTGMSTHCLLYNNISLAKRVTPLKIIFL